MISVAEESGKLDAELVRIAVVTEADLDRNLKTAVALAEPVMLFLIAGSSAPFSSACCCRCSP
jgi:type II secretory pathway component PulF